MSAKCSERVPLLNRYEKLVDGENVYGKCTLSPMISISSRIRTSSEQLSCLRKFHAWKESRLSNKCAIVLSKKFRRALVLNPVLQVSSLLMDLAISYLSCFSAADGGSCIHPMGVWRGPLQRNCVLHTGNLARPRTPLQEDIA